MFGLVLSLKAAPVYPHFGFLPLPFFAPPPHGVGCKKGAFSFGNYGLSEKRKDRVSIRYATETLPCRGHHSATLRSFPWALSGLRPRSTHAQIGRRPCAIMGQITRVCRPQTSTFPTAKGRGMGICCPALNAHNRRPQHGGRPLTRPAPAPGKGAAGQRGWKRKSPYARPRYLLWNTQGRAALEKSR